MCADKKLNSVLYANRAAANKSIGNLRSAIRDCVVSCKFDPANGKAIVRCAECFIELGYGREAVDWIHRCLPQLAKPIEGVDDTLRQSQVKRLRELSSVAIKKQEEQEREERKEKLKKKKDDQKKMAYMKAFKERKLVFRPPLSYDCVDLFDWAHIHVQLAQVQGETMVDMDEEGNLHWPVLLQYPEHGQTDMLTDCYEFSTVGDVVEECLKTPSEWGRNVHYKAPNVKFFVVLDVYEDALVQEVSLKDTIMSVLQTKDYKIVWGLPVLQVYSTAYAKQSLEPVGNGRFRVK
uniref:Wheel domain-containing protein n=1 Tax=Steinernema glaseri TaxID=37863 RepID=A0A1I7YX87_9BILA